MKKIIYSLVVLSLYGCVNEQKEEKKTLGEYIYIDSHDVLHVRNRCHIGLKITDEHGNSYLKSVYRLKTNSVGYNELFSTCGWCVDDDYYYQLERIAKQNYEKEKKRNVERR